MAQVVEALWEQMQRLHLEMSHSHPKSGFLALEAEGQPSSHLGLQLVGTISPPPSHGPTASSWCGDGG
ncbi:hypothetical protein PAXRUDRAFT_21643 [Paxillus rubicundulus Ve08.2h10]|uniref:Uncharacterized protein n=1 Tax=Paxillus rubicundulus Ve08.2h10 TaxID=930991 RepID=A0A0D0CPJ3_9AGAM|nr:hypothetical protein PAXRUDRAFT_21643 [Paxillus rubicundulus Ve08.2h10]